ncbi:MAG: osmoprotectant transport system substrate-binding protein, partial [Mycobacterium sp.]|nr:osmoprotectant transport system substrate-binding protein [Mycobacterium sp.]
MITFDKVSKVYPDGTVAVDNLTITAPNGKITTLVGTLTMTALLNGQIQAGDLFSTDPGLVKNNLVALEDDESLFAAENVVPLIKTAKETDTIT